MSFVAGIYRGNFVSLFLFQIGMTKKKKRKKFHLLTQNFTLLANSLYCNQ